jgi:hypothetical protein
MIKEIPFFKKLNYFWETWISNKRRAGYTMKNIASQLLNRSPSGSLLIILFFSLVLFAQEKPDSIKNTPATKSAAPAVKQQNGASSYRAARNKIEKADESAAKSSGDTIKMEARLIEIPGKFPSNDLYNYVYIMKYKVIKVVKGAYTNKEILVGHYNPLVPRDGIKDKMAETVHGNVKRFEVNDRHMLTLFPLEKVWKDAVEDDYTDADLESYFAIVANTIAP